MTTFAPKRDVRDLFAQTLSHRIGEDRFRRYFGDRDSIQYDNGRVRVVAGSAFQAEMLSRRFGVAMHEAAQAGGESVGYEVRVRPDECADEREVSEASAHRERAQREPIQAAPPTSRRRSGSPLRHELDEFIVGESNRLAHGAALRLAEDGAGSLMSPLFLHGPCGSGKTHLLQGLAKRTKALRPGARVRYTTGEAFTNGFISAVRENRIAGFHAEHRKLDLLCIDDVHFLTNKNATQGELLHTLNALAQGGAPIAMASDNHPSAIRAFSRELISRFMAGMVVGVDAPDPGLRLELAMSFAARRGVVLDREAAELVATRAGSSVRDLEGALVRVEAVSRLLEPGRSGPVSLATVRQALQLGASSAPNRPIKAETIIQASAERLGVDVSDVMGRSRHRRVVAARSIAALLCRRFTTLSYPELAVKLGRPNHSSVVTACQRIGAQIEGGRGIRLTPGEPEVLLGNLVREIESGLGAAAAR